MNRLYYHTLCGGFEDFDSALVGAPSDPNLPGATGHDSRTRRSKARLTMNSGQGELMERRHGIHDVRATAVARLVGVIAAAILAGMVVFAPSPADARTPCATRGDKTIARSSVARVFEKDEYIYGCAYRRSRAYRIPLDDYTGGYLGPTRLAGYLMGHGSFDAVTVRNLRTGKLRSVPKQSPEAGGVFDLELKDTGAFADVRSIGREPISDPSDPYAPRGAIIFEIRRVDSRGSLVVARGSDINPDSLVRRGNYIRWKQGGVVRRATLR